MLVPVVHYPECMESHWLVNEQMYLPGSAPNRFKGDSPVTFICCNKMQYVCSDSVRYKPVCVNVEA